MRHRVEAAGEQTSLADRKRRAGQRLVLAVDRPGAGGDLRALCREVRPAGFLLGAAAAEEPAQVRELLRELAELGDRHDPPLALAEYVGGRLLGLGAATAWPVLGALAAVDRADLLRRVGAGLAREARSLGLDLLLAPPLAGPAAALERVVRAWLPAADGARLGLAPGPFPGEDLDADLGDVLHHHLRPVRAAVAAGAPAVRLGAARVPALDERRPAGRSAVVARRLLREELAFGGVVLGPGTDDEAELEDACRGTVDALLLGPDTDLAARAFEALVRLQERDAAQDDLARDSARRLHALRRRLLLERPPPPPLEVVGALDHRALAAEVSG